MRDPSVEPRRAERSSTAAANTRSGQLEGDAEESPVGHVDRHAAARLHLETVGNVHCDNPEPIAESIVRVPGLWLLVSSRGPGLCDSMAEDVEQDANSLEGA
jgi:hypothetical protein